MQQKQISFDNADALPPPVRGGDQAPWTPPRHNRLDWRVVLILCLFSLAILALLYAAVRDWLVDEWQFGMLGKGAYVLGAVVVLALSLRLLVWASSIVQPGGYVLSLWHWFRADANNWVGTHAQAETIYAARQFPNAAQVTFSPTAQPLTADPVNLLDVADDASDAPLLLPDEWLPRLDNEPHAIFAAKTKGGKSTTVKALLRGRVERGESIFVIDPHTSGWLDLPSVGGGADWAVVERAMATILAEYQKRQQGRKTYMDQHGQECPHDFFPRLTIIFDEANETRKEINRRAARGEKPWSDFTEVLGSGARKVGINVWLICQSALVRDLDLSTTMRRNFTIVALDQRTITELIESEETDDERRKIVQAAVRGVDFPAVAMFEGFSFILDRTGLDKVTPPQNARACAWDGWDYERGRPALRMVQAPQTDADRKQAAIEAQRQRVMRERWTVEQKRQLVTRLRAAHPDWTADEIRYAAYLSNADTLAELRNGHGGSGEVGA
jgi:hypothetical protein